MDRLNDYEVGQRDWPATRAEGLRRLDAFTPRMGGHYAKKRNFDWGPEERGNVSLLSPYLRRRLVTEEEAVRAALDAHAVSACEKFVQEVFWRSYFKGWLEMRPGVWTAYRTGLVADRARLDDDPDLAARTAQAEAGETGLECFDVWARELVETGYLHNHARMWFASIWIFTLDLPWRLGADFFLRHLLDGDPASNTLGWRWVAGLHTQGKNYAAQAWNIAKFTGGRFEPAPRDLDEAAAALVEAGEVPPPAPLAPADALEDAPTALLLTEEDLSPETLGVDLSAMRGVAALEMAEARSDLPVAPSVRGFDRGALQDAALRAHNNGAPMAELLADVTAEDLARWATRAGVRQVATAWAPVGPVRDFLDAARPALAEAGVRVVMLRRPWDEAVWPHATGGFFKVKQKIPALIRRLL
jgi:deoxyribodipyrimidine photo-lyase